MASAVASMASSERIRAAQATGFDPDLWSGLADLGAFALRVPEANGGLGLGTIITSALFLAAIAAIVVYMSLSHDGEEIVA